MRKKVSIPQACRERYVPLADPALAAWREAGVAFSGVSEIAPGYVMGNPWPTQVMVIITTAGLGSAATPAGVHRLEPGTLFVSPPGVPVGWGIDERRWHMSWWYLEPRPRWRGWLGDQALCTMCPAAGIIDGLMRDLLDRSARPDVAAGLITATADLVMRHLTALATSASGMDKDDLPQRFAELWREVAAQPQLPWSLDQLARRMGVSVSTAQRLARLHLAGKPAHRAVVELRLARAQELLRRTAYPISAIADLVGYADAFTFSAAYRRWAGHPPSAARP